MNALYNEFDPFAAAWLRNLIDAGELPAGRVDERSITELTGADLDGIDELHLFAGIGGWPLALRLAGWTGPVWTGSCPCQPFSSAGKRKGTADERHLWPEMFRLVRECRPPVVFGEQVSSGPALGWLDGVFADLEGEGYACWAAIVGAHSVGAPHIRQRLFWVADAERAGVRLPGRGADGTASRGSESGDRQRERLRSDAGTGGETALRLADPNTDGRGETGRSLDRGTERHAQRGCGSRRLGDADSLREGAIGSARVGTGTVGERSVDRLEHAPSDGRIEGRAWSDGRSIAGGCWSDAIAIPCRDGKHRRISAQPGDEPLAHGLPRDMGSRFPELGSVGIRAARSNRVGRLKGYGNAINPQVAAEFVRAFMESKNPRSEGPCSG